jgi:hypothetical protein
MTSLRLMRQNGSMRSSEVKTGATLWGRDEPRYVKEAENERVRTGRYHPTAIRHSAAATDKGDRQAAAAVLMQNWRTRGASAEAVQPSADKSQASFDMTVILRGNDAASRASRSWFTSRRGPRAAPREAR